MTGHAEDKNVSAEQFIDLSGSSIVQGGNPYNAMIEACNNDPVLASLHTRTPRY
jgi:hypothetical protein